MVKNKPITDINQVNPHHRHISGQKLSLDDINWIYSRALKAKTFAEGFYNAKQDFLAKHTFSNGLWGNN